MPDYKTHLFGYLLFALGALYLLFGSLNYLPPLDICVFGLIIGGLYTLFPDVDHPNSKIRKLTNYFILVTVMASFLTYFLFQTQYALIIGFTGQISLLFLWNTHHRGQLHRWYFAIIITLPLLLWNWQIAAFALTGYLAHIILDNIN